ncbi:hypothetical protein HispidOSU_031369 [Sigmodon hispidus]
MHEYDLRQDQQWIPHVAAKLARHASLRGSAAVRACQCSHAISPRLPRYRLPAPGSKRPRAALLQKWIPEASLTDRTMERRTCRPREAE